MAVWGDLAGKMIRILSVLALAMICASCKPTRAYSGWREPRLAAGWVCPEMRRLAENAGVIGLLASILIWISAYTAYL